LISAAASTEVHRDLEGPRPARSEWGLALSAVPLIALTRLALWVLPLGAVRGLLIHAVRLRPRRGMGRPDRVGACVRFASRRMRGFGTCLTESLVAEALLLRAGHSPTLKIGVARSHTGGIAAHAWIECEGAVIVGRVADLDRYAPLGMESHRHRHTGRSPSAGLDSTNH
jgi:hypothetical protein